MFGQGRDQPLNTQTWPRQLPLITITGAGQEYRDKPLKRNPEYSVLRTRRGGSIGSER